MEPIIELKRKLTCLEIDHWLKHELLSFNWWFLLITLIIPWIIWWRIVDKKQITRILFFGFAVEFIVSILDMIGREIPLWEYPYQVQPLTTHLESIDLSLLPIIFMLIYQRFKDWKYFLISSTILSLIGSFIIEPIFVSMGIYELLHWKYIYSLPIYILIGVVCKLFIDKLFEIQSKNH